MREPAGRITTSSTPSSGSASATPEPPPKAPLTATTACQQSPANASRPSTRTVTGSGGDPVGRPGGDPVELLEAEQLGARHDADQPRRIQPAPGRPVGGHGDPHGR